MTVSERLWAVLLGFSLTLSPVGSEEEEPDFSLEVSSPVVSGWPIRIVVTPARERIERPIAVQVILDGIAHSRYEVGPGPTEIHLESVPLSSGRHRLEVRSGTLQASREFEVWSRRKLWGLLVTPLLLFGASLVAFRLLRRIRSPGN